jgi:signal transduction histidine kinase
MLGKWWDWLCPLIGLERVSQDIVLQTGPELQIFSVTSIPLLQISGWRSGQVFLIEEVTKARQSQQQHERMERSIATLKERERLARELHDSLGQTLAAAHLQASTARLFLAQGQFTEADNCLEQMANMTMAAEVDVREYLLGAKMTLSPDHRFFEALRMYVVQFSQKYNLPVELSIPPQLEFQGLAAATEVQLMRIIQEALSNIRKHARAKQARVLFTDLGREVQIAIVDDGQGFDPRAVARRQPEGFGLQSMRERAEAMDGCLEVVSQPGQGTKVVVHLNIQEDITVKELNT